MTGLHATRAPHRLIVTWKRYMLKKGAKGYQMRISKATNKIVRSLGSQEERVSCLLNARREVFSFKHKQKYREKRAMFRRYESAS